MGCPSCDTTLCIDEQEIEFYDIIADHVLQVTMVARWCPECGYSRLSRQD
jgi:uncharacterized Zn finger protein (UPF0148 family)